MERERQRDRVLLQDEKYSSMFAQWKSSAGRGRPDVLEKGAFLERCPGGGKRDWHCHSCGGAWTSHPWKRAGRESTQVCGCAGGICGRSPPTAPTVPVK